MGEGGIVYESGTGETNTKVASPVLSSSLASFAPSVEMGVEGWTGA